MKISRIIYLGLILVSIMSYSCKEQQTKRVDTENNITFKSFKTTDSLFVQSLDETIKFTVEAQIPIFYISRVKSDSLYSIFSNTIFGVDSMNITPEEMVKAIIDNYKKDFNKTENKIDSQSDENDDDSMHQLHSITNISVNIKPIFNQDSLLSISCEKISKLFGGTASVEHQYYNFDLKTMKRIDISDMFNEESIEKIDILLKQQLLKQHNVKSEDELVDLGYFNLDNLFAGNNLYFSEDGITWNFLPLEIGCFNTGETKIFLPYSVLAPLSSTDCSLFSKYIETKQ